MDFLAYMLGVSQSCLQPWKYICFSCITLTGTAMQLPCFQDFSQGSVARIGSRLRSGRRKSGAKKDVKYWLKHGKHKKRKIRELAKKWKKWKWKIEKK